MAHLLTFDIGTTAVKAALFDERLTKLGLAAREYKLLTPEPNIVELSATVYWEKALECVRELLKQTGANPADIAAITCTTQGETLIPIGGDGEPLHNAVVWLDARAAGEAAMLSEIYTQEAFYAVTGIPEISPYSPVAKLLWFKEKRPAVYKQAKKFLLLEDYIIFRLTGRCVTNPSLMCTTGYFDIKRGALWQDVFDKTGLDRGLIPELAESGLVVGGLEKQPAAELGLKAGTPVASGAMDQAAAALGAGGCKPGFLSETTGTCLAVGVADSAPHVGEWSNIPVYSHVRKGLYLRIVVSQTAGIILKWFKDEFCADLAGVNVYSRLNELAASVPPLSRGLTLLPHLAGLNDDPGARGAFVGVSLETGRGCFIRAVLEGVGYMLKDSLIGLSAAGGEVHSMGGGAKSPLWGQIKADICQTPVRFLEEDETASLGAAMLGAVAAGLLPDLDACAGFARVSRVFEPDTRLKGIYEQGYARYRRIGKLLTGRMI